MTTSRAIEMTQAISACRGLKFNPQPSREWTSKEKRRKPGVVVRACSLTLGRLNGQAPHSMRPCLKKKIRWGVMEEDTGHQPLSSTHSCSHARVHTCARGHAPPPPPNHNFKTNKRTRLKQGDSLITGSVLDPFTR